MPVTSAEHPEESSIELANRITATYGPSWQIMQGGVNVVALAAQCVVKVPTHHDEWRLRALAREREVLQLMDANRVDLSPFITPQLIDYSQNPAYLVATAVPGNVLVAAEIRQFEVGEREQLGRDLGAYVLQQIAATATPALHESLAALPMAHKPDFEAVGAFTDPEQYPILTKLCATLYAKWQDSRGTEGMSEHFIHSDLTPQNITLSDDRRLIGVIDFARAHIGTVAEELSILCDVDTGLFHSSVKELQKGGINIDPEQVELWRDMKYIYPAPTLLLANKFSPQDQASFKIAMTARYPELDWSELGTT